MSNFEEFYFFTGSFALIITWMIMLANSFENAKHVIWASWFRLIGTVGVIAYMGWVWGNLT